MDSCIFCKIKNKELPAEFVYEDDEMMAFKDINPKAPVHILIIPKKHIASIDTLSDGDRDLACDMLFKARDIARNLELKGYKLTFNVGRDGGQIVDHLHMHLLGGKVREMP